MNTTAICLALAQPETSVPLPTLYAEFYRVLTSLPSKVSLPATLLKSCWVPKTEECGDYFIVRGAYVGTLGGSMMA